MATLLLRIEGPMQSWGSESKFETRRTEPMPTKSGILGMIASALGRDWQDPIEDLAGLRFGVRSDQPGRIILDLQIAQAPDFRDPYVTRRSYIADGKFVVGLESEDVHFLKQIQIALQNPCRILFLGRKSCPLTQPIIGVIKDETLEAALQKEPWIGIDPKADPTQIRISIENGEGDIIRMLQDNPITFDLKHRQFTTRMTAEKYISLKEKDTAHDAFSELLDGGEPQTSTSTAHDAFSELQEDFD